MSGARIALVEDDERIGASLQRALAGEGYEVRWVTSGQAAMELARTWQPDLMLLDLGLPDTDGLNVCRACHAYAPLLPIVILTARDEEIDVVLGLDCGAVDYVTKPFKLAVLSARVRAHLRQVSVPQNPAVTIGELRLDPASRRVWVGEAEVLLRAKEFDLLARLVRDAGKVVTRETLMGDVWDTNWFGSTKTLDVHIAALRTKIDEPGQESRITTIRGVGYRFELV